MGKGDGDTGFPKDLERTMKEELIISELQLLFSEKRTSLSMLRTGIAVLTIPLSFFTILVATSNYYNIFDPSALLFAIPFMVLSIVLIIFGAMLISRAMRKIKKYDKKILKLKKRDRLVNDLTED